MLFSLNEFLMAVSFALDFVEMDLTGATSNHGKRAAYISLKVAEELRLSQEELHDIVALAILHDNGVSERKIHDTLKDKKTASVSMLETIKEHCIIGEENIIAYPFLTDVRNVIKYHHEKYDGSGFFHLSGNQIPILAQIIEMADTLDLNFDLKHSTPHTCQDVFRFLHEQQNKAFSPAVVKAFCSAANTINFWEHLSDTSITHALKTETLHYRIDISLEEIHVVTQVLSRVIDGKSKFTLRHSKGLTEKAAIMSCFYHFPEDEKMKLVIAADLHDIGKLAIPNDILDSPAKLTKEEFEIMKKHAFYTRIALQEITGFEEITEWASNHHEKLNGQGYPQGLSAPHLDFNSRLLACLDIYQALTEERPYRSSMNHDDAIEILRQMADEGFIDPDITKDIHHVFSTYAEA